MNHGKQLSHLRTSRFTVACGNRGNHLTAMGVEEFKVTDTTRRCAKCEAKLEKMMAVKIRNEINAMQPEPWSIEDDLARFPGIRTAARMI